VPSDHYHVGVIINNVGGYSRGVLRGIASFAYARAWTCRVQGVNQRALLQHRRDFDGLIVQAATRAALRVGGVEEPAA